MYSPATKLLAPVSSLENGRSSFLGLRETVQRRYNLQYVKPPPVQVTIQGRDRVIAQSKVADQQNSISPSDTVPQVEEAEPVRLPTNESSEKLLKIRHTVRNFQI